jgi:hypothetical protein
MSDAERLLGIVVECTRRGFDDVRSGLEPTKEGIRKRVAKERSVLALLNGCEGVCDDIGMVPLESARARPLTSVGTKFG